MLHRCNARFKHFKGGIQGIQIGIDRTSPQTAGEPQFKRVIGRAESEGGEPDMMVAIHQARPDDVLRRAEHVVGLVPGRHVLVGANISDDTVTLDDSAIGNHLRGRATGDLTDNILPTNQGGPHTIVPQAAPGYLNGLKLYHSIRGNPENSRQNQLSYRVVAFLIQRCKCVMQFLGYTSLVWRAIRIKHSGYNSYANNTNQKVF